MGILDEAIREHLELKRQHGAGDSELKKLEDEAFGQAERPGDEAGQDSLSEAPTEFMAQPEAADRESSRREPSIADLQEPPPPPAEPEPEPEPAEPSAEERQAIAEQPTELFEIDEELTEAPSPTDEELVEEEIAAEPRLSSADPLVELEEDEAAEVSIQGPAPDDDEEYEDEDDAFWNEQRLSDELDQALEAPRDPEPESADEAELEEDEDVEPEPEDAPAAEAPRHDDDVLEETPDFLEETPEDDELWFEQKPPKDFDFDD
jgi:hypothetical protein